jgi:hypothetical protein
MENESHHLCNASATASLVVGLFANSSRDRIYPCTIRSTLIASSFIFFIFDRWQITFLEKAAGSTAQLSLTTRFHFEIVSIMKANVL